ncbi:hypothetical protein P2318_11545 [Myxococcaceae bacterium GXIMD 01537]
MDPAADSPEYRVLFFCPSTHEAGLERLESPVRELLSRLRAPPAELALLEASGALGAAGWRVLMVRPAAERSASRVLAANVGEATRVLAAELDAKVLGLCVDAAGDSARICRCTPGDGPETFAGRRRMALERAAEWLSVPDGSLSALFQLDAPDESGEDEQDADDRFVEQKLREARAFMERYRQRP